jgi:hypothetical protein
MMLCWCRAQQGCGEKMQLEFAIR